MGRTKSQARAGSDNRLAVYCLILMTSMLLASILEPLLLLRHQACDNVQDVPELVSAAEMERLMNTFQPWRGFNETGSLCFVDLASLSVEPVSVPACPTNTTVTDFNNPDVTSGGEWRPRYCVPLVTMAIVIPYRDRAEHLGTLLSVLHPLLRRQKIHYRIFVVEQFNSGLFNKGMIMNIAFQTAATIMEHFDCVVFHDVDLVPTSFALPYRCPITEMPRHMSGHIDGYKLGYRKLVGGVLNIPRETFVEVNGFSNRYWGWGGEDDDMYYRLSHNGYGVRRLPASAGTYAMLPHPSRSKIQTREYRKRVNFLKAMKFRDRSAEDGLTTIPSHDIMFIRQHSLYTHIMIDVGSAPYIEEL